MAVIDAALEVAGDGLYMPPNTDSKATEAHLRSCVCEPFVVEATVEPPGFPFSVVGEKLSGLCIARTAGYWLVYQPEENRFLCFWGESEANLGAHGVYGNPLYCWSA